MDDQTTNQRAGSNQPAGSNEPAEGDHQVEGIDSEGVARWFDKHVPGVALPLRYELVAGGRSNLTFKVTDQRNRTWVLRRPPLGHVLATAHDMGREHTIISALGPTDVPVPPTVGLCTDADVNGSPFYVMDFVDGQVWRTRDDAEAASLDARGHAGASIVDVLARIHAVDPDAVGLGDLGKKQDYVARQLRRWHGQWEKSALSDLTVIDQVHGRLAANIPEQGPATVVHGDYRLDNCMVDDRGEVIAVLDWEICTLGDPMADVGLLQVYWADAGDDFAALLEAPTTAAGFLSRADLLDRYAERSGRDVSNVDYFVAFGYWKLACILAGVYTRWAGGAMGEVEADRYGQFAGQVTKLAEAAQAATDRMVG